MTTAKVYNAKHLIEARNVVRDDRSDDRSLAWACEVLSNSPSADDRMIARHLHPLGRNADLFERLQDGSGVALVVLLSATFVVVSLAVVLASYFLPL